MENKCDIRAERLRVEYLVDPAAVQEREPRLSWIVVASGEGKRNLRQRAYRIVVASSPEALAKDDGDLWDTGRVESSDAIAIPYAGQALASRQRCWWKVMLYDADGNASEWSKPATWAMGLLDAADWQAKWIGFDAPRDGTGAASFDGATWIWHAADIPGKAPKETRHFAKTFEIQGAVAKASLLITADDQFTVSVNGTVAGKSDGNPDAWRRARVLDVAKLLKEGANEIAVEATNTDVGHAGLLVKLTATTKDGRATTIVSDASWRSSVEAGGQSASARALGAYGANPWGKLSLGGTDLPPARYLRKEFALSDDVKRATLYATALGNYRAHLNGKPVEDLYFSPSWTDYNIRIHYHACDVTDMLGRGDNAIGVELADGWYSGYIGYGHKRDHYGRNPRFMAQLEVELADGTRTVITTDDAWRVSTGPILQGDFLMGETYDATREITGWTKPSFDAAAWKSPDVSERTNAKLEAAPHQPVRVFQEIRPVGITEPRPGTFVFDMGTNFAGVARLNVTAPRGTRLVLRHAERLNPDGTIYTRNLRSARATDTYVCRGGGEEVYQPRFTFHGFQYVELTGYPGRPTETTITGIELTSSCPVVGKFECPDAMLTQLYHNICQTQRSNFIDIPTDCPQRDERLGWTGDAQVYISTATCNNDVQAFFTKWLVDLEDSQHSNGEYPMVAPRKVATGGGGPAWADAGTICPWTIYQVYGDTRVLALHYESMKRFVEFTRARNKPGPLPPAKYHCFGDWLAIGANTPKDVIYMAYFAASTRNLARAAKVLGKTDDAAEYGKLYDEIKASFNESFVGNDGRVKGDTQCCYVLALAYDLLGGDRREKAAARLIEKVKAKRWHLSTGFVGTKDLMLVLSRIGRTDVAYRLLHNDTFPSWGFSVKHGATSIWERWNGWTPDKGFGDPGMNSFAHYSFGAVYGWIFERVGGIAPLEPGYGKFLVAPEPGGKLPWAKVSYDSIRGMIRSHWRIEDDRLRLEVEVPPNTTAEVRFPSADAGAVKAEGEVTPRALGVRDGRVAFEVGSGVWVFEGKWDAPRAEE